MKSKFSKQREAIRAKLYGREDHPTAETLYYELKEEFPNLSFATVYRNLSQMVEKGEIAKINLSGPSRFDYNPDPHSHFFCTGCGCVMDMPDNNIEVIRRARENFDVNIESCSSQFYGMCPDCKTKMSQ